MNKVDLDKYLQDSFTSGEEKIHRNEKMNRNIVDHLINDLNTEGINYVHWKSNIDLAEAKSGEMDLDFLVDRESFLPTVTILSRLGFKPALTISGANPPGISHFYAYDAGRDRFAHIHLFSRVLTGESFLKSHFFPFERMMLSNPDNQDRMKVASKPAELVLFIIRTYIKFGSPLDLAFVWKKTEKIKAELAWLNNGSDLSKSVQLLNKHCPVIDEGLFTRCIETLNGNYPLYRKILLSQKVRNRIRNYSKYTWSERAVSYFHLLISQIRRKLGPKKKSKVLQNGGTVIALVGADGTGKSTLTSEINRWLGEHLASRKMHAGKPPASLLTAPLNLAMWFGHRILILIRNRKSGDGGPARKKSSYSNNDSLASLMYAVRAVALAWDRRKITLKGWRSAARGEIVIFDRYPSITRGAMDSPRLQEHEKSSGWISSLYNTAARLERRLYDQIPPPDVIIRLHVPVEIAKERNRSRGTEGEEPDEYIEARHAHPIEWHRSDTERIFDVSTDQPLSKTIKEIKEIVWKTV